MNVIFVLLAENAFSDVTEGVYSESLSRAPLAWSTPPTLYMNNAIDLQRIKFKIFRTFRAVPCIPGAKGALASPIKTCQM